MNVSEINEEIKALDDYAIGNISDGYHTFNELYEHRVVLYIAFCKAIQKPKYYGDSRNTYGDERIVWRSKKHNDGTMYNGWFIMGINKEKGKQITYHLPEKYWDSCAFADTLEKAPKWDSHTPMDVLTRLAEMIEYKL